ncbi:phosphatidate cytidylyltransferase [Candidatus Pseudothioglobus sp. Uisw_086]|uniref:phosphatidate cytidylyltransferase n=1 Tax=Candidatus Pseudothioglobus sp. Uisw_086 TaxID=3230998 RepID=UPI003A8415FD
MLHKRILTASIVAPIVILGVLILNSIEFALALALILIIGSWEYCRLVQINHLTGKALYTLIILVVTYFLISTSSNLIVLYATSIWWLIALIWVVTFPNGSSLLRKNFAVKLFNGLFIFVPMAISLMAIHSIDKALVLFLLVLIWAADIGAYFAGKLFGKTKLCPSVSPGKTLEGVFGGAALAQVVAILYVYVSTQAPLLSDFLIFSFIALVISLVSVLGDLFESVLKRIAEVKDSGNILPGHGGILDRIDSLTSSAPIFFLLIVFLL